MPSEIPFLRLTRNEQTPDGVFGVLAVPGLTQMLVTAEDDWLNNARGRSCIPAGQYALHRTIYQKHQIEVFEVVGVPGRKHILLHAGNTEEDTEGCILLGTRIGTLMVSKDEDTGLPNVVKRAAANSRAAFTLFMRALSHTDQAVLTIEWAPGLPSESTPV